MEKCFVGILKMADALKARSYQGLFILIFKLIDLQMHMLVAVVVEAPGDSQLERHLRKGAGVRACPRTLALVRHDRIRGGQEFTVFFLKEGRAPPSLLPALQSLEGQRAFHKAERARE